MKQSDWKQRREIKDAVGVDALRKTINEYEEKLCKLHTENLSLQHEIKSLHGTIEQLKKDIEAEKKDTNTWHTGYQRKCDELKKLRASIDFVERAMSMDWLNKFFHLRGIQNTVQIMIRGW